MITISHAIDNYVKKAPFLEDGLTKNIINLTALARQIRPEIEELTHKPVTEAAIVMALKRRATEQEFATNVTNAAQEELYQLRNVTVRSNLIEYALKTDPRLSELFKSLLAAAAEDRDLFVNFSQGVSESTLIISRSLAEHVESSVNHELIIDRIDNLAAITLRLRPQSIYIPGVHYQLLKAFAWEGINIVEVVSSYNEMTQIVAEKDIDRVFSIVKAITTR